MRVARLAGPALLLLLLAARLHAAEPAPPYQWWKGNLHTHSLWSDGDDFPEMVADWYKRNGYHFLAISDHNLFLQGRTNWIRVPNDKGNTEAFDKYLRRFGRWVDRGKEGDNATVRLRPLDEFRPLLEEPGRFLLLQAEELTDLWKTARIHVNGTNLREVIQPKGGNSVLEVMQNNVNAVLDQRRRTGQLMFPHINHPNYTFAVTAEELMRVQGERFFEVYNGHARSVNDGDTTHASLDRIWDIVLTMRLAVLGFDPMFGLAVDDAHNYHAKAVGKHNPGRGWIVVRSRRLAVEDLITAMEYGDFYASTGVAINELRRLQNGMLVSVEPEDGVSYTIQFIGTRKGFDRRSEPVRAPNGEALRMTHRYSNDIGAVLAEVKSTTASYHLKGDEIYVRAKIISSKPKANPSAKGEFETAWTQPLVTGWK